MVANTNKNKAGRNETLKKENESKNSLDIILLLLLLLLLLYYFFFIYF